MKNIVIVAVVVLFAGGAVALGFFGVENAIARRPVESSLDKAISEIANANPSLTVSEEDESEVPQQVNNFLKQSF